MLKSTLYNYFRNAAASKQQHFSFYAFINLFIYGLLSNSKLYFLISCNAPTFLIYAQVISFSVNVYYFHRQETLKRHSSFCFIGLFIIYFFSYSSSLHCILEALLSICADLLSISLLTTLWTHIHASHAAHEASKSYAVFIFWGQVALTLATLGASSASLYASTFFYNFFVLSSLFFFIFIQKILSIPTSFQKGDPELSHKKRNVSIKVIALLLGSYLPYEIIKKSIEYMMYVKVLSLYQAQAGVYIYGYQCLKQGGSLLVLYCLPRCFFLSNSAIFFLITPLCSFALCCFSFYSTFPFFTILLLSILHMLFNGIHYVQHKRALRECGLTTMIEPLFHNYHYLALKALSPLFLVFISFTFQLHGCILLSFLSVLWIVSSYLLWKISFQPHLLLEKPTQ